MSRRPGRVITRRIAKLDPNRDADEIARLSLAVLHGNLTLTYALFTVAFMEQVAIPTMARILYRRGTGDIVQFPVKRNDDTIVFFGSLLDHGPDSPTGRAWIDRMNHIHSHFPIRNDDSLYTLSTLALDPHSITSQVERSVFSASELEAHWEFWRRVAVRQGISGIPDSRTALAQWAQDYEAREFAPSHEGRAIADALIEAFAERCLPRRWQRHARTIISIACSPNLRRIHDLPEPSPHLVRMARIALRLYRQTIPARPVPVERSLAASFGDDRYGPRTPSEVGYRRPSDANEVDR